MTQLTILTLGAPEIAVDGVAIDTSRNKAIALLVYLAVTGERCRREALATLFWPEYEQSKAYAYLRRTLWEIKDAVGEGWLDADRETVRLHTGAEWRLDVREFRQRRAATATHGHAPAAVCPACIEPLSRAAELYRGDFLAGFSLRDSPGFDDWQFYLAEGLRQEAGDALRRLAAIHGSERRLDAAIDYARRWLALDPLNEEAHRQLMLLHALNGQRSAALRQYQECVRVLQSEMGIAPERRTAELSERIEHGKIPSIDGAASPTPIVAPPLWAGPAEAQSGLDGAETDSAALPPVVQPAHHNLPQLLTPFIGRDKELAELDALLADPHLRLLTILAVGGMGKTRLAIETAARHIGRFDHGVVFLYLAPLQSPSALVPALLDALQLTAREGISQKTQVLDYLREKRLLLVLDNFEHLLGEVEGSQATELVREILHAAPGVRVLATSRLPLNLQGEHRYHLAGLDFPTAEHPGDALDTSAVKLFVQAARRALPGFKLAGDDLQHVVAICRLVEGMPLGILLAAGWLEMLSPQAIVAQMRSQRDFLETDVQDMPERHRSMRLVLQHTWDLMSDPERQAFERLSVFRGSFDRRSAQEVSGAALRVLMSLVNKSLLMRLANDRLAVHELLRQYAAERLSDDLDAYEDAHDRHSELYCRWLQSWIEAMKTPSQRLSMVEIETELENARAAWNWAALDRQVARLAGAVEGMGLLFSWHGRNESGEAACKFAADALGTPANAEERVLLGYLLAWQAMFASSHAHVSEVIALSEQSLAWLSDDSDPRSRAAKMAQAFALYARGQVLLGALDHPTAHSAFEESLALFEQIGDRWWIATVLECLGHTAWTRNDLERTWTYFQRSLAVRREIGDRVGTAGLLINLGGLAGFDGGQVDVAEKLYRESSQLYVVLGGLPAELSSLGGLQAIERLRGRFDSALEIIRRQVAIAAQMGDQGLLVQFRMVLGEVQQLLGHYELAEVEHRKNMASLEESGWTAPETWERLAFAAALLGLGNYAEAQEVLQPNILALEESHSPSMLGRTLAAASRAELGLGKEEAAWDHALTAVSLLSGRHYFWLLEAMAAAAAVLAARGEAARAVEIYALVNRHPYVANSRWFGDVFGQLVAEAAGNLSPDRVAAAKARGEAMDLWQAARDLLDEYGLASAANQEAT